MFCFSRYGGFLRWLLIVMGALIIIALVPFWIWCAMFGIVLIGLGCLWPGRC